MNKLDLYGQPPLRTRAEVDADIVRIVRYRLDEPGALSRLYDLVAEPVGAAESESEDDPESLIEQLDEALCSLLHEGNEVGEHSPRTHLDFSRRAARKESKP